jgi:site-specific recombinase XerD
MLGHSNINTTTFYADVMEEDIRECLNRTFLPFASVQQPKNQE